MKVYELRRETMIARPLDEVFQFFADARNLEIITPPFLKFHVLTPGEIEMRPGAVIEYKLKVRGVPIRWRTVIQDWDPPRGFSDNQARGPYALWFHTHRFEARDGGTWMEDVVHYALPLGILGRLAHWMLVERDVQRIFDYRTEKIQELFGSR